MPVGGRASELTWPVMIAGLRILDVEFPIRLAVLRNRERDGILSFNVLAYRVSYDCDHRYLDGEVLQQERAGDLMLDAKEAGIFVGDFATARQLAGPHIDGVLVWTMINPAVLMERVVIAVIALPSAEQLKSPIIIWQGWSGMLAV